ncbi:MAG: FAD-dependent oxidoreductase [Opitutales bacterium]
MSLDAKKNSAVAYDVVVVGAGAGGICAALAAARNEARTLLLEKAPQIGGTGVHSPVSLICKFHGTDHRPINMGIHREMFPHAYRYSTRDKRSAAPRLTYDEKQLAVRYRELLAAEPGLTVRTGAGVAAAEVRKGRIAALRLDDGERVEGEVFIDATADGNLGALAGAPFQKGREADGALQSATLVFTMSGVDRSRLKVPEYATRGGLDSLWKELSALYREAKEKGETDNPKKSVVCFPYPDGERLLFNANEVLGVDPTEPDSVEKALATGRRYVDELVAIIKRHPAFANAQVDFVAEKMGVREGRRILGDYVLTQEDCLRPARFDDMVVACAYEIDIHDPDGGATRMVDIPDPGYYHIPYRCLIAKDLENLLLGSRCISGDHEAHSSYRVISGVSAIGQAAGTAAALAVRHETDPRGVPSKWIRFALREQLQFVEGETEQPPQWTPDIVY